MGAGLILTGLWLAKDLVLIQIAYCGYNRQDVGLYAVVSNWSVSQPGLAGNERNDTWRDDCAQ